MRPGIKGLLIYVPLLCYIPGKEGAMECKLHDSYQLFIPQYYRYLSADIKMKHYKIKSSFVSPEGRTRANKTGLNFTNFILIFYVKFIYFTGLEPIINQTEKSCIYNQIEIIKLIPVLLNRDYGPTRQTHLFLII